MNFFIENEIQNNKKTKEMLLHENFKNGNMKLIFLSNSDDTVDNKFLVKFKALFQKQLSKMPKEYILRQIFDYKHISLGILNQFNNVIGGICYRPFYDRNFFEIVFCAVDQSYQVKGIGSFMMDVLKEHIKDEMYKYHMGNYKFKNIFVNNLDFFSKTYDKDIGNIYFITYADNFAIGYFQKQGFRQNLTFDSWVGYIKDYEGGTIMECNVFWEINYLKKFDILEEKRSKFIDYLKRSTDIFNVYNNNTQQDINSTEDINDNKEDCIEINKLKNIDNIDDKMKEEFCKVTNIYKEDYNDDKNNVKKYDNHNKFDLKSDTLNYKLKKEMDKIPGISSDMIHNKDIRNRQNCLNGFIQLLINILKNDQNAWPFLEPVSAKDVPEYYEVIKSPMDLSRIKDKFNKKLYTSLDVFISDVHLMLNNCFKFNGRETQYYKCAQALFEKFEEKLKFYDDSVQFWNLKNKSY